MQIPWNIFRHTPATPVPTPAMIIDRPRANGRDTLSDEATTFRPQDVRITPPAPSPGALISPVTSVVGQHRLPQVPESLKAHFSAFEDAPLKDTATAEPSDAWSGPEGAPALWEHIAEPFFAHLPEDLSVPGMRMSQIAQHGVSQAALDRIPLESTGDLLRAVAPLGKDTRIFAQLSAERRLLRHFHYLPVHMKDALAQPEGPDLGQARLIFASISATMAVAETHALRDIQAHFDRIFRLAQTAMSAFESHIEATQRDPRCNHQPQLAALRLQILKLYGAAHDMFVW